MSGRHDKPPGRHSGPSRTCPDCGVNGCDECMPLHCEGLYEAIRFGDLSDPLLHREILEGLYWRSDKLVDF